MEIEVKTYAELESFLRSFADGHHRLIVIAGPPGVEKTTLARNICEQAEYIVCNVSAFHLYRLLYQYQNEDFILDDVDHLAKDAVAVRLLKALTDSQRPRVVAWHTASPLLSTTSSDDSAEGIPTEFETTSRVVIVSNNWKTLSAGLGALADRGLVIDFRPTNAEIHCRVGRWFQDEEIYQFIGAHLALIKAHSMRVYIDALDLKQAGHDWRDCLLRHWNIDRATAFVVQILNEDTQPMRVYEHRFIAAGLGSRATFYRIVRQVRRMIETSETLRLTAHEVSKSHHFDGPHGGNGSRETQT